MNNKLRIIDIFKNMSLVLMALYFSAVMILSYSKEYYRIANLIFVLFAGCVFMYRIMKLEIKNSEFYYYMGSILVLSVMSYFWAIDKSYVLSCTKVYFNLFLLAITIINIIEEKKEIKFALKALAFAGVAMCIYTILFYGYGNMVEMLKEGERLGGDINQTNVFGFFCVISFAILITYAIFDKKISYYFLVAVLAICALTSGSRKVIISMALIVALIVILNTNSKKVIGSVIVIMISIYLFSIASQSIYFAKIFERFDEFKGVFSENGVTDSSTALRLNMLRKGLEWFSQRPVLGYGVNQFDILYEYTYGLRTYSHNFYIQQMVSYGVAGLTLYLVMFTKILKNIKKHIKESTEAKVLFILTILFIINGFVMEYSKEKIFFIILGIGFAFINVYKKTYRYRRRRISKK